MPTQCSSSPPRSATSNGRRTSSSPCSVSRRGCKCSSRSTKRRDARSRTSASCSSRERRRSRSGAPRRCTRHKRRRRTTRRRTCTMTRTRPKPSARVASNFFPRYYFAIFDEKFSFAVSPPISHLPRSPFSYHTTHHSPCLSLSSRSASAPIYTLTTMPDVALRLICALTCAPR